MENQGRDGENDEMKIYIERNDDQKRQNGTWEGADDEKYSFFGPVFSTPAVKRGKNGHDRKKRENAN